MCLEPGQIRGAHQRRVASGASAAVRRADRVPGDRLPGAAVPGADLQHAAQGVQLQRDPQPARRPRHHVRPVHARAAGDPPQGRRHANFVAPLRHDHQKRGRTSLQEFLRRQLAAKAARPLRLRGLPRVRLGLQGQFRTLEVRIRRLMLNEKSKKRLMKYFCFEFWILNYLLKMT